ARFGSSVPTHIHVDRGVAGQLPQAILLRDAQRVGKTAGDPWRSITHDRIRTEDSLLEQRDATRRWPRFRGAFPYPLTHTTCLSVWTTSTRSACAAITASMSL